MYQTYTKDIGADGLICFPFSNVKFIFPFCDKLTEKICSTTNLYLNRCEGEPKKSDSWFRFFNSADEMTAKEFFSKKHPGFWACALKTKTGKEYKSEEQKIRQLVQIEIVTSHDHTCIEVYSSKHSEDLLSELIENVAKELRIDMPKNSELPSMTDIIMTNRRFGVKT
jgi:hypothetical protein